MSKINKNYFIIFSMIIFSSFFVLGAYLPINDVQVYSTSFTNSQHSFLGYNGSNYFLLSNTTNVSIILDNNGVNIANGSILGSVISGVSKNYPMYYGSYNGTYIISQTNNSLGIYNRSGSSIAGTSAKQTDFTGIFNEGLISITNNGVSVVRYTNQGVLVNCGSSGWNTSFTSLGYPINSSSVFTFEYQDYKNDRMIFNKDGKYYMLYFFDNCSDISNNLFFLSDESVINTNNYNTYKSRILGKDNTIYGSYNTSTQTHFGKSTYVDIYAGLSCTPDGACIDKSSICIYDNLLDITYLCNNSYVLGDNLSFFKYCDLGNITYCSQSCNNTFLTNIFGVEYEHGTCYQSTTCTNDCTIQGLTQSDTSTSYQQCGFYDSDVCLDWSVSIPCPDGEYSIDGFCETLNTSGYSYYSLTSFGVTPQTTKTSSYSADSVPPKASYTSSQASLNIGFDYTFQPTSSYISKNCDYSTTKIQEQLTSTTLNSTNNFSANLPTYINGYTTYNLKLQGNETINIRGTDNANTLIYLYNIYYNTTLNSVCLLSNMSLLGCESVSFNDIKDVVVTIQTTRPQTNQLHSVRVIINKISGGYQDIYTSPISPLVLPVNNLAIINVYSNNNILNSVQTFNEAQLTQPFKNTTWTQINNGDIVYQHTCLYTSIGCRTVRSYYKTNLIEGLWNYKDVEICINGLNGVVVNDENGLFDGFSKKDKIIFSFIVSFVIGFFVVIFGLTRTNESESKIFIFTGLFVFFGALLVFLIIEWLPFWLVIVPLLLAGLGVGLFFIRKAQGD